MLVGTRKSSPSKAGSNGQHALRMMVDAFLVPRPNSWNTVYNHVYSFPDIRLGRGGAKDPEEIMNSNKV